MNAEYPRRGDRDRGVRINRDVIVESGQARRRKQGLPKGLPGSFGHASLSADVEIPWSASRLVIGTEAEGSLPVIKEVSEVAEARGVELVGLKTNEACRLLRSARGEEVNAILHVTC